MCRYTVHRKTENEINRPLQPFMKSAVTMCSLPQLSAAAVSPDPELRGIKATHCCSSLASGAGKQGDTSSELLSTPSALIGFRNSRDARTQPGKCAHAMLGAMSANVHNNPFVKDLFAVLSDKLSPWYLIGTGV